MTSSCWLAQDVGVENLYNNTNISWQILLRISGMQRISEKPLLSIYFRWWNDHMMTSSNRNIFSVTGPLCGEFTSHLWIPAQRPVTRSFDVFFDLCLNKRLIKQSWHRWFETPSGSLLRRCNEWKSMNNIVSKPMQCWSHGYTGNTVNICRLTKFTRPPISGLMPAMSANVASMALGHDDWHQHVLIFGVLIVVIVVREYDLDKPCPD